MPQDALIHLQLIGPVTVRRADGRPTATLLTQPRPLAVLAYLVLARPRGLHSRDTILALLWPDAPEALARHALRNALHTLRAALGDGLLVTAGASLVGVDGSKLVCDVLELERVEADPALARLPQGSDDLMQGFHVSGAPDFEHWLDGERARLTHLLRSVAAAGERQRLAEAGTTSTLRAAVPPEPYVSPGEVPLPATDPPPRLNPRGSRRRFAAIALAMALATASVASLASRENRQAGLGSGWASFVPRVPPRYRTDTALLQRYLRADGLLDRSMVPAARESLLKLVDDAPLYAPAWAGLSTALSLSAFGDLPPRVALPRSVAAAERALALDESLVEAEATMIANELYGRWDLPAARRRLDAALARFPDDPQLTILLGSWHRWRGEFDEAVGHDRRALALAPMSPRYAQWLGGDLYLAHRCREAAEIFRRGGAEFRNNAQAQLMLYRALRCRGRMEQAAAALQDHLLETGDTALAARLETSGSTIRRDSAIAAVFRTRLVQYFTARERGWRPALPAVQAYAELRNADSVMVWLDSMYAERAMALHKMPFDPMFDFMRDDPRYQAFIRRLPWHSGAGP